MDALARMLDANVNRAREGLRVMEDAARFGLDDAALSGELKAIRHGLRAALDAAGVRTGDLLAARDTPGDVGTTIWTESEGRREGLRGAAAAAGARAGEALRVVEECLKACGAGGGAVEGLRYRAYEAASRLDRALGGGRAPQWALCVLVTESLCRRGWEDVARGAIAGGADCLQLREKALGGRELLRRARRLVEIAAGRGRGGRGPHVIVNDRPDIARLARADGVHLGQDDLPAGEARRFAGEGLLVGVSTSNLDEARAAVREGADYCGVGSMFATATKDKPRIAGPEYLRAYLADPIVARVPHLAIGGVTPELAGVLREAGCRGVAVSSAVCGAEDPEAVCRSLVAAMRRTLNTEGH